MLPHLFRCSVLEIVIEQTAFCVLIGFVLSIVLALAALRPRRPDTQSILARLVLAGVPVFLGLDYLVDQGSVMLAVAAATCGLGLYCFRGWWLSGPNVDALVEHRRPAARLPQAELLRYRIDAVVRADRRKAEALVRADRRYPYGLTEGSPAKAA
jgi:hypothetical protein